jgi:hypothetical protein
MATIPTSQQYETDISFVCPSCTNQVRTIIQVPEPNWEEIESTSDIVTDGDAAVVCPECKGEFVAHVSNFEVADAILGYMTAGQEGGIASAPAAARDENESPQEAGNAADRP